jgi:hypothetical protein
MYIPVAPPFARMKQALWWQQDEWIEPWGEHERIVNVRINSVEVGVGRITRRRATYLRRRASS